MEYRELVEIEIENRKRYYDKADLSYKDFYTFARLISEIRSLNSRLDCAKYNSQFYEKVAHEQREEISKLKEEREDYSSGISKSKGYG